MRAFSNFARTFAQNPSFAKLYQLSVLVVELRGFEPLTSLLVAVLVYGIVVWFGGVSVGAHVICYLWLASLSIMLVNIGLCDLFLPIGALLMLTVFALG